MSPRTPLILTFALALGCAAPEVPDDGLSTVQGAIKGGYADHDDVAVVGMASVGGGGGGICSGTLIAPNVVLTAQHCVARIRNTVGSGGVDCVNSYFDPPYKPSQLFVTTEQTMSYNPNIYHGAREVLIPPGDGVCGRDVALIILSQPVDPLEAIPITPRVDTALVADPNPGNFMIQPNGERYSAVGYGQIGDDQGGAGARRRRDDLFVRCEGNGCPFGWDTEWIGDTGICSGDSGGPALDVDGRVVGVASRGASDCRFPTYGYVYGWGEWIKQGVIYASGVAQIEPPNWSLGWPTHPGYQYSMGESCTNGLACESGLCLKGYCSRLCNENAVCPAGFQCVEQPSGIAEYNGNYCEPAPVGGECTAKADCSGRPCVDGVCSRGCSVELPCPSGWACNFHDAICHLIPTGELCASDEDCPGGAVCNGQGICTRSCDDVTAPCPGGWNCDNGLCVQPSVGLECAADADCETGKCLDGLCTRECSDQAPCVDGYACEPDAGICVLIEVGNQCVADADCDGGVCDSGECTRACHERAPCPTGFECLADNGVCSAIPDPPSGCTAVGHSGGGSPWLLLLVLAPLAIVRRRSA